jgi:hypothetical protein
VPILKTVTDDELDDPPLPAPRRRARRLRVRDDDGFRCPFCGTSKWPITSSRISTGGWVLFVGLLFFCFPLCWIGFFVRESYDYCDDCGVKLG